MHFQGSGKIAFVDEVFSLPVSRSRKRKLIFYKAKWRFEKGRYL